MDLAPFASVDRSSLGWRRTSERPLGFTLVSGDRPVAVLRWPSAGTGGVEVETADGRWTLARKGFLAPRVTLKAAGSATPLAQLAGHLHRHLVTTADGATYWLQRAGMLIPAWTLSEGTGGEVAHVEPVPEGRRLSAGAVVVAKGRDGTANLLALLVLAWYFVTLVWFEDETVEALAPFEGPDAPVGLGNSA